MSYPRRSKGWRTLTVEHQQFWWRFSTGVTNILTLQGTASSSRQVVVTLRDWHDPWSCIGQAHLPQTSLKSSPPVLCARLLISLWHMAGQPEQSDPPLHVDYRQGTFTLPSDRRDVVIEREQCEVKCIPQSHKSNLILETRPRHHAITNVNQ